MIRSRDFYIERKAKMVAARKAGQLYKDIAKEHGIGKQRAQRIVADELGRESYLFHQKRIADEAAKADREREAAGWTRDADGRWHRP